MIQWERLQETFKELYPNLVEQLGLAKDHAQLMLHIDIVPPTPGQEPDDQKKAASDAIYSLLQSSQFNSPPLEE